MTQLMPAPDAVIIFISDQIITEGRMFKSFRHCVSNAGRNNKVHICHPHRDQVKTRLNRLINFKTIKRRDINSNRVFSFSFRNSCKIKFHFLQPSVIKYLFTICDSSINIADFPTMSNGCVFTQPFVPPLLSLYISDHSPKKSFTS